MAEYSRLVRLSCKDVFFNCKDLISSFHEKKNEKKKRKEKKDLF
jgi:hypothetical protein